MIRNQPLLGSILFATLALATAVVSLAQAPPASDQLQEVIVTAERRTEKLQDVPISMSAITGETLENFGEKTFDDYATGLPNLARTYGKLAR